MTARIAKEKVDSLSSLKNVGPATRRYFTLLGIKTVPQLAIQDPDQLYTQLSVLSKSHQPA